MARVKNGIYKRPYTVYHEDRLVQRIRTFDGYVVSRGKRVPQDCEIPPHIRKIYVKEGRLAAIKALANLRNKGLRDAIETLTKAIGKIRSWRAE